MLKSRKKIAELRNGDLLTRREFERRYEAMPHVKKAELIEGVVIMGSPVSRFHSRPHGLFVHLLSFYFYATPGTEMNDNITVRLSKSTEPQPDVTLSILPSHGGRTSFTKKGYLDGAPELVVEIAYSSVSNDAHSKKQAYRDAGVNEYILYRIQDEAVDWFELADGEYRSIPADADGLTRSRVFPGLALDLPAILRDEINIVTTRLQAELAGDEHRGFVERLAAAASAG